LSVQMRLLSPVLSQKQSGMRVEIERLHQAVMNREEWAQVVFRTTDPDRPGHFAVVRRKLPVAERKAGQVLVAEGIAASRPGFRETAGGERNQGRQAAGPV